MSNITIKDIAKQAGVSIATVSYILNDVNTHKYSDDTRKKVLQIVNLYDYRPSKLAQAFTSGKSGNIILAPDKQDSVFQKAECLDFILMLSLALEKISYNLLIKSELAATKIDTADAIVCLGTEEDKFLRLAKENFVPLLTVDARVRDQLFFQVSQDFDAVMRTAVNKFGAGNFYTVLVDTYNKTLKEEICKTCGKVLFISQNSVADIPSGNIVTVNRALTQIPELNSRNILLCPALTDNRINAVITSFKNATTKESVESHYILV